MSKSYCPAFLFCGKNELSHIVYDVRLCEYLSTILFICDVEHY